jgi:hypothetical protein
MESFAFEEHAEARRVGGGAEDEEEWVASGAVSLVAALGSRRVAFGIWMVLVRDG